MMFANPFSMRAIPTHGYSGIGSASGGMFGGMFGRRPQQPQQGGMGFNAMIGRALGYPDQQAQMQSTPVDPQAQQQPTQAQVDPRSALFQYLMQSGR